MGFRKGFLWGAASSAYQTEGGWNADGKGPGIWDTFCHTPGHIARGETGDTACDGCRRMAEDVALLRELGFTAYRFSISWPRIFPEGRGYVNQKGLAYYDKLVDLLLENGIIPFVTLYHWDLPESLEREGGWQSGRTAEAFAEYAALIARHFDGRVRHYTTLNEPQCFLCLGYGEGIHAPGLRLDTTELLGCARNILLAGGLAARALRENSAAPLQIGISSTGRLCYPVRDTAPGRAAACRSTFALAENDWMFTHSWFLDAAILGHYQPEAPAILRNFAEGIPQAAWTMIRQLLDFLGVNVYHGTPVDETGTAVPKHPGFPRTALKWPVTPEVLYYGSRFLYDRYRLPLYITENGQSCNDRIFLDGQIHDPDRIDFLHRYLLSLRNAAEEGVPVLGYFHWSFTDNFEWHSGYDERMGLVYIDYPTGRRIPKDSARWYAQTVRENGALL